MTFVRTAAITSGVWVLLTFAGAANAELIDRGGGLIYDSDQNITWLANANYGAGSAYDDGASNSDGAMTWQSAMDWAANLSYYDSVRGVTWDDWHLPTTLQIDPTCSSQHATFSSGVNCKSSDLGHLFYVEFGNVYYMSVLTDKAFKGPVPASAAARRQAGELP